MLSLNDIAAWGITHPWASADQIEQDLLLSRAICAVATDPYLGQELVFRGGTALHKLHLPQPLRYSEDLDYVRTTSGGIGELTGTLLDLGRTLGFDVRSRISEHPKVFWRTTSQTGTLLRIKIEVNTHERSPALPVVERYFQVVSPWWAGEAAVRTFQLPELIATKLRALYQRSKGRDLFDLWLALTQTSLEPTQVLSAFAPYRPYGYTTKTAIANLQAKLATPDFRHDSDELAIQSSPRYDPDEAAALVINSLLSQI
ncbi:MAG: nucleotidyl transferase AbiEii/AbiGii toxin family protein [Propionibacteriaceae bacterium]|jgi:predicted nucleotidyltransferase component of viral defense system|nr:nucleotidyl transferase AbiEii/AbiGii toxin family protein [Propionibacteriaceae bacterium]